ncbi:hypothetical protein SH449x_000558 [Pirellulaceae bacterium SH449]
MRNTNERFEDDLGNGLRIAKTSQRFYDGRTWVGGSIAGYPQSQLFRFR